MSGDRFALSFELLDVLPAFFNGLPQGASQKTNPNDLRRFRTSRYNPLDLYKISSRSIPRR
jgi:hypothetical protein